jgi:PhnO protein
MDVIVRRAVDQDVQAVYRLLCDLEQTTFQERRFIDLYRTNLQDERIGYFIAQVHDRVVGFASVHINVLLHHCGAVGEVQELMVAPDFRRQGVGRRLLGALTEWCRAQGALQLEVTCNNRRVEAQAFYQANGFVHTHQKLVLEQL